MDRWKCALKLSEDTQKALDDFKRRVEEKRKMKEDCLLFLSDICDSWNEYTPAHRLIYSGYDEKADLYYINSINSGSWLWSRDDLSFEEDFMDGSELLHYNIMCYLENMFKYLENDSSVVADAAKRINKTLENTGKVSLGDFYNLIGLGWESVELFTSKVKKTESKIKRVVFNAPATIILWKDGTKTVVKCGENETYDLEKGLAMALVKHFLGNEGNYNNLFRKYLPEKTFEPDDEVLVRAKLVEPLSPKKGNTKYVIRIPGHTTGISVDEEYLLEVKE